MRIHVNDGREFDLLLQSLTSDVTSANVHYRLFKDLEEAKPEYETALRESWTFWWLTISAHRDTTLYRLSRIFDQQKSSLSLRNLLQTIEKNIHLFDERHFRERLKDNTFVDTLAKGAIKPDERQLLKDIQLVNCSNPGVDPRVKKLVALRNEKLAHRSPGSVLPKRQSEIEPMTWQEIEGLLDLSLQLVNRYGLFFKATTTSVSIVGHDDYRYVLNAVQEGVERSRRTIEEELAQIHRRREAT